MTMISDPDMPAIDIGPGTQPIEQAVAGKPSNVTIIGVVAAGALLITAANLTAAIYLFSGINELRSVEGRLEQLGSFEQRIAARLDTVNNGFQSRFEKLDNQLQGSFSQINGSIARIEQNLPLVHDDASSVAEPLVETTSATAEPLSDLDGEEATERSIVEAPRPPKKRSATPVPPAPSSSYRRIEQPDGKVYYRKID
ncbi:hypothetical protein NKG60_05340 [Mesorhizobium sp. M1428]|uniref:hypothetical protein n=1 Tax=unclassified Mesorhizobium TaxID=325217 RepID=UPI00333DF22D